MYFCQSTQVQQRLQIKAQDCSLQSRRMTDLLCNPRVAINSVCKRSLTQSQHYQTAPKVSRTSFCGVKMTSKTSVVRIPTMDGSSQCAAPPTAALICSSPSLYKNENPTRIDPADRTVIRAWKVARRRWSQAVVLGTLQHHFHRGRYAPYLSRVGDAKKD